MRLVARASRYFSGKNLLLLLMCAGALCWFAYDGWVAWPERNDRVVKYVQDNMIPDGRVDASLTPEFKAWPGWNNATAEDRDRMTDIIGVAAKKGDIENWKTATDINTQHYIVYGLLLVVIWAAWRFIKFARARVIAEDSGVSPAPGVFVPWDKITVVDNSRWKSGLVTITYTDEKGEAQIAVFDDYEIQRDKLLPILDLMAEKATSAEFKGGEEDEKA